jgi:hypothetical protein
MHCGVRVTSQGGIQSVRIIAQPRLPHPLLISLYELDSDRRLKGKIAMRNFARGEVSFAAVPRMFNASSAG